jgi:hypothetical protein
MNASDRVRRLTLMGELERIEQIERNILSELGHSPSELNEVLDRIHEDHQIAPRNRKAYFAVMALVHLKVLKVEIWDGDPVRAVSAALRVGAYGGSMLHDALGVVERRVRGGHSSGAKARQRAGKHDRAITRHFNTWLSSDSLQEKHRASSRYISEKIPEISQRTIVRRLKALGLHTDKR